MRCERKDVTNERTQKPGHAATDHARRRGRAAARPDHADSLAGERDSDGDRGDRARAP